MQRPNGYLDLPLAPVHGSFLAVECPEPQPNTLLDPLGTVVVGRASYINALEALHKVHADIFTIAASLEKNRLLLENAVSTSRTDQLPFLLGSELEYLFVTVRALFDQLQFIVRTVSRERARQDLPQSFNRMVGNGSNKYGLPDQLRDWYGEQQEYLDLIRDVRVGIEHYGHGAPQITLAPGGIAVLVDEDPWRRMPIWDEHCTTGDRALGSLFRGLAWIVDKALLAGENLAPALEQTYLAEITPITEWALYLHSPLLDRVYVLERMFNSMWDPNASGMDTHVRNVDWPPGW